MDVILVSHFPKHQPIGRVFADSLDKIGAHFFEQLFKVNDHRRAGQGGAFWGQPARVEHVVQHRVEPLDVQGDALQILRPNPFAQRADNGGSLACVIEQIHLPIIPVARLLHDAKRHGVIPSPNQICFGRAILHPAIDAKRDVRRWA